MTKRIDQIEDAVNAVEAESKSFAAKFVEKTKRHAGKIKVALGVAAGVIGTVAVILLTREIDLTDAVEKEDSPSEDNPETVES